MRYKIVLGDYSGDGHSITETRYVEVNSNYTREQLEYNFLQNCRNWGFSPYDIANEYGSNVIQREHADILLELGIDPSIFDEYTTTQEDVDHWNATFPFSECPYEAGQRGVDEDRLIEICMFFVGYGLEDDFSWSDVPEKTPTLFGGWGGFRPPGENHTPQLGYGLYQS